MKATLALTRALLRYAREELTVQGCEQGGCGRPAPYESVHGEYVMCGLCTRWWYRVERGNYDPEVEDDRIWMLGETADGRMRPTKDGWFERRFETRRRDAPGCDRPLSTAGVEVLIQLGLLHRKRSTPASTK